MTATNALQYLLFLVVVTALVRPTGVYMQRVFTGQHTLLDSVLGPVERSLYRLSRIDPEAQMD